MKTNPLSPRPHRARYRLGLSAERLCRLILRLKCYRILAVRYKTPVGEIDIVARRGRTVIAVEVKARPTREEALFSVTPFQQKRIANALLLFVKARHLAAYDLRFDVMLVTPRAWPMHLHNAFRVE